ncbi:hypothetical protein E3N88_34683 [Mikania micrantha]|uniref:Reverse transcriptase Ty1/copia-type domain-containing protein n=1 Tax=Mikania micrantha TaxID=192012 RepID=A0A5N6M1H6_9ASTR|nr:hypothetical protein E3N88_34683 [Mikania micrantha]
MAVGQMAVKAQRKKNIRLLQFRVQRFQVLLFYSLEFHTGSGGQLELQHHLTRFPVEEWVDYNKIFSPVVNMTTIRLILSIVASDNLHLQQLDVKIAFLHGHLDEDIYTVQSEGFQISGKENMVCKLKKSLYVLKQAPRQWYLKFDNFMGRNGFKRCEMDHCCYINKFCNSYIILLLYVNDMLISGSDMKEINKLKKQMSEEFEMKDLAHAVGVVSRYMSNLGKEHWDAVKWLLQYLKGTSMMSLCFKGKDTVLRGYTDADLGGCKESYKSTTGYVFSVGGNAFSWMSKLQKSVALSTTEAEYMAAAEASKELIWLKNFLEELGKKQQDSHLYCDNQSTIHLGKNPVFHGKTKHIQLRYHLIREFKVIVS